MNKQSSNSAFVLIVRLFWAVSVLAVYLDAIASVGLHMSVCWCPFWWWNFLLMNILSDLLLMEFLHVTIPSGCSLANWFQLLVGQRKSAAHWPDVSFLLANWCQMLIGHWYQLLIGQLMSASHWPTDVSFSLANWNQLLIDRLKSAAHWLTDISCSLSYWCQLLIG